MNFEKYLRLIEVAKECHIANNALMVSNGEIENPVDWNELDTHTKNINLASVLKIYDYPNLTAEDIHDEWMLNKIDDGWVYGEVKDVERKTHPLICDFDSMNDIDKMKDQIFIDKVNSRRNYIDGVSDNEVFV